MLILSKIFPVILSLAAIKFNHTIWFDKYIFFKFHHQAFTCTSVFFLWFRLGVMKSKEVPGAWMVPYLI